MTTVEGNHQGDHSWTGASAGGCRSPKCCATWMTIRTRPSTGLQRHWGWVTGAECASRTSGSPSRPGGVPTIRSRRMEVPTDGHGRSRGRADLPDIRPDDVHIRTEGSRRRWSSRGDRLQPEGDGRGRLRRRSWRQGDEGTRRRSWRQGWEGRAGWRGKGAPENSRWRGKGTPENSREQQVELPLMGPAMYKQLWDIHPQSPTVPHQTAIIDPGCGFVDPPHSAEGACISVRNIRI